MKPLPLTLLTLAIFATASTNAQTPVAAPMAADAHPAFEVATIKPSSPDHPPANAGEMGHRVVMSNTTILFLMSFAYDVQGKQIANPPPWVASKKFDLNGVADTPGSPSLDQLKIMLQTLLADRLHLRLHHEQREMSAYVLTLAKNGPKLQASKDDPHGLPSLLLQPGFPKVAAMKASNLSMTDFTRLMQSGIVDRPMVDGTGLHGKYDFLLRWTPDESQFTQAGARMPPPSADADAPSLTTAMQEQLGLRLTVERRTPVDNLVVDNIEQPSPN